MELLHVSKYVRRGDPRAPFQGAADEGGWGLYRQAAFPMERYNIKPATTPSLAALGSPLKGGTRAFLKTFS